MLLRIKKLANGKFIAEIKKLFGWRIICQDFLRQADVKTDLDKFSLDYVLTHSNDYRSAIRYNEASYEDYDTAVLVANNYASIKGKSLSEVEWEGLEF